LGTITCRAADFDIPLSFGGGATTSGPLTARSSSSRWCRRTSSRRFSVMSPRS